MSDFVSPDIAGLIVFVYTAWSIQRLAGAVKALACELGMARWERGRRESSGFE